MNRTKDNRRYGKSPHSGGLPFISKMAALGSLASSGKCNEDTHRIYLRSAQWNLLVENRGE